MTLGYYPFGLKQKGYNNNVSGGNDLAQQWKYNGVELNESLGLDLYEMFFRSYDPAIGRFNGMDPVVHYSQGTSVAFDNNPIFWADPSGANSYPSGIDNSMDSDPFRKGDLDMGLVGQCHCSGTGSEAYPPINPEALLNMAIFGWAENGAADLGIIQNRSSNDLTHMDQAVSLDQFVKLNEGKSFHELRNQAGGLSNSNSEISKGGPDLRYIIDPQNPEKVIDMRHFLVVGMLGEDFGYAAEIFQGVVEAARSEANSNRSSFKSEDLFSNKLGRQFFNHISNTALAKFEGVDRGIYLNYALNDGFIETLNEFLRNR